MNIDYNCQKTWSLIASGATKGIFQLETQLAQSWLKQMKPSNIWELSALIAALRPGCLTGGYCKKLVDCKNGVIENPKFGHEEIDNILGVTWSVLLYQESLLALATKVAWKDYSEIDRDIKADMLRKATSKKSASASLEIGKEFQEGCIRNGVDKELAAKLFDIIIDCGRYLFNNSHSNSYSHISFKSAWRKANYPLETLATYLTFAQYKNSMKKYKGEELTGKWKEINDLVRDAQKRGIQVLPPNINCKNQHFAIEGESVRYGLIHLKGFASRDWEIVKKIDRIDSFAKWLILCNTNIYGKYLNKKTINSLILSGAFSDIKIGRRILSNVQKLLEALTERELKVITENIDKIDTPQSLIDFMPEVIKIANKGRREKLESLTKLCDILEWDHPAFIEESERQLLGIPLTASSADLKDNTRYDKCSDCYEELPERTIKEVMVVIQNVRLTTIKNGKNSGKTMAKLAVYDSSGNLEIPVFSELYEACSDILIAKNIISLNLLKGKQGWIANGIHRA